MELDRHQLLYPAAQRFETAQSRGSWDHPAIQSLRLLPSKTSTTLALRCSKRLQAGAKKEIPGHRTIAVKKAMDAEI